MAVRAKENGQFGPHGIAVLPACRGVRVVHAAVGAPVGKAAMRVAAVRSRPNVVTAAITISVLSPLLFL